MRAIGITGFGLAALLAACTPADSGADEAETTAEATPTDTPSDDPAPEVFAATAWRATAEDGARYITYLDADGTYRDIRNGDPWQTGSWTYDAASGTKLLCFTPDDENGVQRCWKPGAISGDTMEATSDSGKRIALDRMEYQAPAEDDVEA